MRALVAAGAAALALVSPASAAGNVVSVSSTGSVYPGLVTIPAVQFWSFTAPGSSTGLAGAQPVTCTITGTGTESVAGGSGQFYGDCGTVPLSRCAYTRAGAAFTGACVNGASVAFAYTYTPASTFTFDGTVQG